MKLFLQWFGLLFLGGLLQVTMVQAAEPVVQPAVLTLVNRDIVSLRAVSAQGETPAIRVSRALERFRGLNERERGQPIGRVPVQIGQRHGLIFSIGDQTLFILYQADLDAEANEKLDQVADGVEKRLREALDASIHMGHGQILLKGISLSVVATLAAFLLLWAIQRATAQLLVRLRQRVASAREKVQPGLRWVEQAWLLVIRLAQLVLAFLWVSVAYLWFTFVLSAFPLTEPYADRLSGFLVDMLGMLGHGVIVAIPGTITVLVILFLTKAANDVAANIFQSVDQGRTTLPGLHKDTAQATRRLVGILIWGLGIAIAYPYLPLANSDAFKGLSVMFGFMLTLGSAGIVTQIMSGLVLIYSRALRVGDFVSIGEVVGVVKEMGLLSTKVINMRNEEVTIPNAVLVGNPIKNYTSGRSDAGTLVSTTVTIGYDTPWRQVHALLIGAAEQTNGLRTDPKPFVMQKSLQDFYVEYELFAYIDRPLERVQILSGLHANIQDQFNTHGVQIMSPHFVLQPKKEVVVEPEKWFSPPAERL